MATYIMNLTLQIFLEPFVISLYYNESLTTNTARYINQRYIDNMICNTRVIDTNRIWEDKICFRLHCYQFLIIHTNNKWISCFCE